MVLFFFLFGEEVGECLRCLFWLLGRDFMGLLEFGGLVDVGVYGIEDGVGKEVWVEVWKFFFFYINLKISWYLLKRKWRKEVDRCIFFIFLRLLKFFLLFLGCVFLIF